LSSSGKRSAFRGSLDSPVKPGNDEREKKHENDRGEEKNTGMTRREDDRKITGRIWQGRREEIRKMDTIEKKRREKSRLFKILLFCLRTGSEPTELPEKQGSAS